VRPAGATSVRTISHMLQSHDRNSLGHKILTLRIEPRVAILISSTLEWTVLHQLCRPWGEALSDEFLLGYILKLRTLRHADRLDQDVMRRLCATSSSTSSASSLARIGASASACALAASSRVYLRLDCLRDGVWDYVRGTARGTWVSAPSMWDGLLPRRLSSRVPPPSASGMASMQRAAGNLPSRRATLVSIMELQVRLARQEKHDDAAVCTNPIPA